MKVVQWVAGFVILVMLVNVANVALMSGMNHGVGFDTFLAGIKDPWQELIDNDMMSGLYFACTWMIFRERGSRPIETVAWIWLVLWWGNIVVAVYVLRAVGQAEGDWSRFFLGRHAPGGMIERPLGLSAGTRAACVVGAIVTAIYLIYGLATAGGYPIALVGYFFAFAPIVVAFGLLAGKRGTDALAPAG